MPVKNHHEQNAFLLACRRILEQHPQAIGVAFKWLDCGCSMLCGVSPQGDPLGRLVHVSAQPSDGKGSQKTICLQCRKDGGLSRVVWQGIHWPGTENELPDRELRLVIGRSVFGPGYTE